MLPSVLLLLTAGWFSACESDDDANVTDLPGTHTKQAIGFGEMLRDMQTGNRASRSSTPRLHEQGVTEFHVWGYKNTELTADGRHEGYQLVFNGYTVKYGNGSSGTSLDNTDGWHYVDGEGQSIKYWDFSAKSYLFFGTTGNISNIQHSGPFSMNGEWHTTTVIEEVTTATPTYFSKLWFSNNAMGMPEFGKTVQMEFFQPFCKVRFMFVDENGQPLTKDSEVVNHVKPGSIRFEPYDANTTGRVVCNKGSFSVHYPITGKEHIETYSTLPSLPDKVEITVPYESHASTDDYVFVDDPERDKEKWYEVFPSNAQDAFVLSLEYDGKTRKAIVPQEYMDWKMNHKYTYVFKLTPQRFKFDPSLYVHKEWQSGYTPTAPETW